MQFTAAFLTAVLSATTAFAAPVAESKSMMAAVPQWTIQNMKRVCTADAKSCAWSFGVNTGSGAATACAFTVKGSPASQTDSSGNKCGPYTVSTGWSDQFGADNAFTTLSVVDFSKKLIVYPAYTDKEIAGGKVVSPDKAYAPAAL